MEKAKLSLIVFISFGLLLAGVAILAISQGNQEVALRNQVEAQQMVLESEHDKMWKVLKQKAGVAEQYRETFEGIYPELISGRYSGEAGAKAMMFKLVQEDNPDFDPELYVELSRAIEAHRESFHAEQSKLIDLQREHKTLIETFPGNVILSKVEPVEIQTVTSKRSTRAMASGVEDEVSLF